MQVLPFAAKRLKLDETSSVLCTPVLSKRKQEAPLPRLFDVPLSFPPKVEGALLKNHFFERPWTKFITVIAQSIYRCMRKSYPIQKTNILTLSNSFIKNGHFLIMVGDW